MLITWSEWLSCCSAETLVNCIYCLSSHETKQVLVGHGRSQKNLMPHSLFSLSVIHTGCKMPSWTDKRPNDKQNDLFLRGTLLNVSFSHLSVSLFPFFHHFPHVVMGCQCRSTHADEFRQAWVERKTTTLSKKRFTVPISHLFCISSSPLNNILTLKP